MKTCEVCLNPSDEAAPTCAHCGQASWAASPAAAANDAGPPPGDTSPPASDEAAGADGKPEQRSKKRGKG